MSFDANSSTPPAPPPRGEGAGAGAVAVGVGLRQPHYAQWLEAPPRDLQFFEVHSENFFAAGGAALAVLRSAREHHPVSLHGVGLALGSAAGLDTWHLDQLARLVDQVQPVRVSDHASFARVATPGGTVVHGNDLLPIAFTPASLAIMVDNVQRVQERLRRPIAVENLSAYLGWADDSLDEADFFNALTRRSGCELLLDVNNLVVNALNAGVEPVAAATAFIDRIDARAVVEIHLAGYCHTQQDGVDLVIDDHGSRVHPPVWQVYRLALQRLGAVPTLVEWDTDLPDFDVLHGEALRAAELQRDVLAKGAEAVAP